MKIKINGKFYNFFNDVTISYKLDSVASVFSFKARFNPDKQAHREVFLPLGYKQVEIFSNAGKLLFTGNIINTSLGSTSKRELQVVSGYSKAGILEDCTIPFSSYPLEKLNVSLEDVVSRLLQDFNLQYIIDSTAFIDMKLQYKKTVAQPSETIKSFISKLASQRNIILSHNEKGDLVFFKPDLSVKPKMYITVQNSLRMSLNINGQALHSEISVIRQPSKENTSLSPVDTISNDLVQVKRTIVKVMSSGSETETKKAADNVLSEELKSITFVIELNFIADVKCGDIVEVLNPEIYLYNRARLVITSIVVKQDSKSDAMTLNLVLPETFTGQNPKNIFL